MAAGSPPGLENALIITLHYTVAVDWLVAMSVHCQAAAAAAVAVIESGPRTAAGESPQTVNCQRLAFGYTIAVLTFPPGAACFRGWVSLSSSLLPDYCRSPLSLPW